MDNISDLIPLIIILGSFIISITRASKKKKAQKEAAKTMLPQGVYDEKPKEKPVVSLPKTELFREKSKKRETGIIPPVVNNPEVKVVNNPKVKKAVASVPDESILVETKEEDNPFIFDATDTNELKRAIIYAEILNRKEY